MNIFRYYKGKKNTQDPIPKPEKILLKNTLKENLDEIREELGNANDLLIRELELTGVNNIKAAVLGIDGLINSDQLQKLIIHVLAIDLSLIPTDEIKRNQSAFDSIYNSRISMIDAKLSDDLNELYTNLLNGHAIVLMDGVTQCMFFDCKGWEMRSIGEPNVEKSLRGPKDSYVETIRVNTALLRRRIKDPRLRFDSYVVGRITKTDVFVCYIEGITNPKYVQLMKERISEIDVDRLLNASELSYYIKDQQYTVFPNIYETERPDKTAAALMEGQIAIFVDGSPFALLGPSFLTGAFESVDDYYNPPIFASLKRIMRYFSYFAIILIPGFYISVSTFHQEMIPSSLLVTIISQRSSNPFSTFVETLIILVLFEILREASLRKPDAIGDSMTIVGSLIIGQTIVEAGLVSYAAIIVGSLTTIASFVVSSTKINVSARILTVCFMLIGSRFGFYGITLGYIALITHLCALTTFGEPYLAPLAPFNLRDQQDQLVRFPITWMKYRPEIFKTKNKVRHNLPSSKERKE